MQKDLEKADLIVGNSASLKKKLTSRFPGLRPSIRYVHLGVDSDRFRPPTDRERSRVRKRYRLGRKFVVAYAGRIIPRKGVDVLIRAVRRMGSRRKVGLLVAGTADSAYARSMRRLSHKLGVSARFAGQVPHPDMHELYWGADCFVCPSQKHEAFGLVNVEAMATGLPIVASGMGGIKEIVRHKKNGLLVRDYRSPKGFSRQLKKLFKDPVFAKQLGQKAREDILLRFPWKRTAERLAELYRSHS
ncbi:glycosyltransferase family 4 protein [Paenibacillus sp. CC-CFT747]|nr:glycosyltransferase family 4 protein [Paenibacillus sp. CC-CFT747]